MRQSSGLQKALFEQSEILRSQMEKEASTDSSDFQTRQAEKEERVTRARGNAAAYAYANESKRKFNRDYIDSLIVIGSIAFAGTVVLGRYLDLF